MQPYATHLFNWFKRRTSWALPVELFVFVYFSSWLLMAWAEPDARITQPDAYWWWFATTVTPATGSPGFHPATTEGQAIGVYVIVGGIVTITMLFTRLARAIESAKGLRMHGRGELKVRDHIAIFGYTAGRTEHIIDQLMAEEPCEIALCVWDDEVSEHPIPTRDDVHFVRGNLTDDEVLRRAALPRASAALVDVRDDHEALSVTVAVNHTHPAVHIVVALRDLTHAQTFTRIADNACCVQWHSPQMITEELRDAGMSLVYNELMSHSDRNTYSLAVPASLPDRTFGEFQQALGRWNAATILAIRTGEGLQVSPSWNQEVPVGTVLYYVARRRLRAHDLERYIDRSERVIVPSDQELLRSGLR